MGVVTTEPRTLGLPRSRPLRRADLAALPDDGHRYELLDGSLIVTPSSSHPHQRVAFRVARLLDEACPEDVEIVMAPFDVALADDTVLQPDVLVVRLVDFTHRDLPTAPLLAIEVLSPSTQIIDRNAKKARYEAAACPAYWVIDPLAATLTAWELENGVYVQVAQVAGDEVFAAARPFPVEVVPNRLVTR
ncbi:MAG: Uma2 family endonuclease [Nocardioides sp.]